MLRTTLSRPPLLRSHRSALAARHGPLQGLPLAYRRLYSSSRDSRPGPSAASNRRPAIELPPPSQLEPDAPQPSSTQTSSSGSPTPSPVITRDAQTTIESQASAGSSPGEPVHLANTIDVEEIKEKLRSWTENAAGVIRDRADRYTTVAAMTFAQLGRELNKVTGYGEIESLKRQVTEQESRIRATRDAACEAKIALERAVQQRSKSQREVNDLLQRKSSWTDEDVGRFTALVRQDHLYEQAETCAKTKAIETEEEVDREFTELMRVILSRYHEEQVWSDKIRSASTYGSLTVLGLNMAVFILAIIVVEPWKRRRLAQTFERKVEEMSAETISAFETRHEELAKQFKDQDRVLCQLVEAISYLAQPSTSIPVVSETDRPDQPTTVDLVPAQWNIKLQDISQDQLWIIAASATVAGVLGWLAGNCFAL